MFGSPVEAIASAHMSMTGWTLSMRQEQPNFSNVEFLSMRQVSTSLNNFRMKKSQMAEKNTRYQTKSPSLSEISFPNTPVKPASITAICNGKYDFFIRVVYTLYFR